MTSEEDRRAVREILKAARAVEERRDSPFGLDVGEALSTLAHLFPRWTMAEDLCLDARALNALSRVLQAQEGRLRYEAALFLADPEGLVEKLGRFAPGDLAETFVQAWTPVVELEQITIEGLTLAHRYWMALPPWEGRWPKGRGRAPTAGTLTEEELAAMGILSREGFLRFLGDLWQELKDRGTVDYWAFIEAEELDEALRRAYGVSFLVTYGYADLRRTDGDMELQAHQEQMRREGGESLAVALGVQP